MKFTRIEAVHFKGLTFDTTLKPVTVIRGRNFVGKTSRLEALELAATSATRAVGRQANVLHEAYASGMELLVAAHTDAGERLEVGLSKSKKGSVAMRVEGTRFDPMIFSPAYFTGLSGPERLKYLFGVLPPPPLEKVGPDAIVTNLKNIKLEPHTKEAETAINELAKFVRQDYAQSFAAGGSTLEARLDELVQTGSLEKKWAKAYCPDDTTGAYRLTVQDWLSILTEQVRLKANAATAAVKRMKATAVGTTELQLMEQRQAALAPAEAEKTAAQEAARQLGEQLAALRSQYNEKKIQRDEAQAIVDAWVEPDAKTIQDYESQIVTLRGALAGELLVPEPGPEEKAEQKKVDDLTAQIANANEEAEKILLVSPQAEADRLGQQRRAATLAGQSKYDADAKETAINGLRAQLDEIVGMECCPTCKASAPGWKGAMENVCRAAIAEAEKQLTELRATAASDAAELERANGIVQQIEQAKTQKGELLSKIINWQKELGEANRKLTAFTLARGNAAMNTRNTQRTELARLEGLLTTAKGSEAKRAEYTIAKAKVPQIQAEIDSIKANGENLKQQQTLADVRVQKAEETHRGAVSAATASQTAAKAVQEAQKAQAEADITNGLAEILAELLRLCVKESVQPLLDTCNSLAAGVLTAPVAIEDGSIGLKRGEKLVGLKTCSDAEQMLINAGLSIALASGQSVKLAIIGRFESLDYVSKPRFVEQMLKLVETGKLDQCIVVEVSATANVEWATFDMLANKNFAVVNI